MNKSVFYGLEERSNACTLAVWLLMSADQNIYGAAVLEQHVFAVCILVSGLLRDLVTVFVLRCAPCFGLKLYTNILRPGLHSLCSLSLAGQS